MRSLTLFAAAAVAIALPAAAHHGWSSYDESKPIKLTGTFTELPNSPVTYGSHGSNDAWVAADGLYEFPYSVPLSYDPEVGGDCQDFPNTARVLGDGAVVLDHADASVSICPKAGTWEVSKVVAEPFALTPGTTMH